MAQKIMKQVNPVVIPRNHIVEEAIYHATVKNNQLFLKQLLEDIKSPYAANKSAINYIDVPLGHDDNYQTFCGT
jgi:uncharacterized protein YdiU (UPF0061 family)